MYNYKKTLLTVKDTYKDKQVEPSVDYMYAAPTFLVSVDPAAEASLSFRLHVLDGLWVLDRLLRLSALSNFAWKLLFSMYFLAMITTT